MLIFYCKSEIDQNVAVWLKNKELIRILKFEDNVGNRSKCWNLSAKCIVNQNVEKREIDRKRERSNVIAKVGIDQNVGIWKNKELIRNLRTKLGIDQNVEIWVLIIKSIKMLIYEWKVGNQPKSWNLDVKGGIHQNVKIKWKVGSWSKYWNLGVKGRLIKLSKFECKMTNRSKCWNFLE